MSKVIEFLKGKKTYVVGGLMILLGIFQGNNDMVLEGLGFIFLRTGIKTLGK